METENYIEVINLVKHFKNQEAVCNLSFNVFKGEIFGFLGPNGAGKSTTIRMILGLLSPDSGSVNLFGKQLKFGKHEALKRVGAIVEEPKFYEYLSALKNLEIAAKLSGCKVDDQKIMNTLELMDLHKRFNSKVGSFSQGMKQRLGIARTLIHDPDLLIYDEPGNGLDPKGMKEVREFLVELNQKHGKTLLISSHILRDIELIASRVLIINNGKKIIEGRVQDLLQYGIKPYLVKCDNIQFAIELFTKYFPKIEFELNIESQIIMQTTKEQIIEINRMLIQNEIGVYAIIPLESLEDYFLTIT